MTPDLHNKRQEIQDLLQALDIVSSRLCVNGKRKVVEMIVDEVKIGFFQQRPENSYQTKLYEEEFHLTFAQARSVILETIRESIDAFTST